MTTEYEYYYNNVPGVGLCRNNLIYTSLISKDKKTFVQWYNNDTEYHKGQNQVIDKELMDIKWARELHFLHNMAHHNPSLVPEILDVSIPERKIYLKIDGVDFWQRQLDGAPVPSDWQEQIFNIIKAHKARGWYKYSMHPSSYFVVEGQLKSINYFFTYSDNEGPISIEDHQSHLSNDRKENLKKLVESLGMSWTAKTSLLELEHLCWESFRTNYPSSFVDQIQGYLKSL
jgi:hypothetical protein